MVKITAFAVVYLFNTSIMMDEIRWNTRYFYVFMQKTFKNSGLRPHKFETCQTT